MARPELRDPGRGQPANARYPAESPDERGTRTRQLRAEIRPWRKQERCWPRRYRRGQPAFGLVRGSRSCFPARRSASPACRSLPRQRPPDQEPPGCAGSERCCRSAPAAGSCRSTRCRNRSSSSARVRQCGSPNPSQQPRECRVAPAPPPRAPHSHTEPPQRPRRSQPQVSCAFRACLPPPAIAAWIGQDNPTRARPASPLAWRVASTAISSGEPHDLRTDRATARTARAQLFSR